MKTSREFWERLGEDTAFAEEVNKQIESRGGDLYSLVDIAGENGYELTKEEIDGLSKKSMEELSDEELGKVAGGTWGATLVISGFLIWATLGSIAITGTFDRS